ncbi:MAG: Gfo/Idh/MocA family oxidoreductase [Caldilineaceae bacterium]|nr:Gfo/Idh/MocA family oxidoreductase [Caldilineaceae bacterium]
MSDIQKINPVSAALLGVEHPHSLAHLRTLQQLPEVERIYLWDSSEEALARVRKELPDKVVGTYTNLGELLAQPDLYFVIAALRNDLGKDIFIRCLDAGKHVMAEKPIGRNAAETSEVIAAAKRAGRQLGVCYQNRANAVIQEARRIVAAGALGPLMTVEMRMITTAVRFRKPEHWLFDKEKAGGGMLSWLGCHYIDLMRYITQDEIVSVQAEVATRSGEKIDVEDVAVLSLRLKSGAVASLHVGYILALSGGGYHNSAGYDTYIGINGRLGRIHWSSPGAPSELKAESAHPDWAGAPQWASQYVAGTSPAYGGKSGEDFIRRFIASAQQGTTPWTTGEDALIVARIVDAAYESSRTGKRVEIEQLVTA